MERSKELQLLAECIELFQRGQPPLPEDEALIPVVEYSALERFEREISILFRGSMNLVAHSSQIPGAGDFITFELIGLPVLLVRDEEGRARAFLNVCRHRGATLEPADRGSCKRFVCPYHAWTYRCDGSLARVRHPEGFPSVDVGRTALAELPLMEASGFIWVRPDPTASSEPPDSATQALLRELAGLGFEDLTVFDSDTRIWNANWKLIVDGGLESYHFRIAHRATVGPYFADNISSFEMLGDHVRTVLPKVSITELREKPQSEWDIREHTHLVYALFPNATILAQRDHIDLILIAPLSVDQTRIQILSCVPDPGPQDHSDKARTFWTENHRFTKKTLFEDFELAEQIQRGLRSGANETFRFARFEAALTRWHRLIDAKLSS